MCLGIPGKIVAITDSVQLLGVVDVGGIQRAVDLSCVAQGGEALESLLDRWVLVHVGFAMSVIDETEAQATLAVLTELGQVQEELAAMQESES
ncbi:HypC/HybG/HupF family hydrogenase formation chaperone [Dyella flagellata]|uniref:Hydrogenase assembly protein HupF n=1 Tax=Dyella flagellata TaxID=1867833 RepID=A0ABQ5X6W3_9GAMM|nr:HypC/HybG/HupF family hydrogenase formation chaperone [Dyella flagellata]GLQ87335.1 hydrogenase assembly protein HupF [Dyella flagellata]